MPNASNGYCASFLIWQFGGGSGAWGGGSVGGSPTADRERSACLTYFGVNGEGCWGEWPFCFKFQGRNRACKPLMLREPREMTFSKQCSRVAIGNRVILLMYSHSVYIFACCTSSRPTKARGPHRPRQPRPLSSYARTLIQ
jgi:hypothetical protein